jgi:hypothetical protein
MSGILIFVTSPNTMGRSFFKYLCRFNMYYVHNTHTMDTIVVPNFELDIVQLLDKYPKMSRKIFMQATRRISHNKWGVVRATKKRTGGERALNEYQKFVKDTMPNIIMEHPEMTPQERIKHIATMWDMQMKCGI